MTSNTDRMVIKEINRSLDHILEIQGSTVCVRTDLNSGQSPITFVGDAAEVNSDVQWVELKLTSILLLVLGFLNNTELTQGSGQVTSSPCLLCLPT